MSANPAAPSYGDRELHQLFSRDPGKDASFGGESPLSDARTLSTLSAAAAAAAAFSSSAAVPEAIVGALLPLFPFLAFRALALLALAFRRTRSCLANRISFVVRASNVSKVAVNLRLPFAVWRIPIFHNKM